MTQIHPTAVIEKGAELSGTAIIGPFCYVGPHVKLGEGVELMSHVTVMGHTDIGMGTKVFPQATLGCTPQSVKYSGEPVRLNIGQYNIIRENVTIHLGTASGDMETSIGDHCFLMVGVHIAHDCHVGNHVIMANQATLGGHVIIGDYANLGGLVAVHQRVRIGEHAMIGGMSGVEHDVIPYGVVMGDRARLTGLNLVGLKRRGFSSQIIQGLRQAYQEIFDPNDIGTSLTDRVRAVADKFNEVDEVMQLIQFIQADSHRHLCVPRVS